MDRTSIEDKFFSSDNIDRLLYMMKNKTGFNDTPQTIRRFRGFLTSRMKQIYDNMRQRHPNEVKNPGFIRILNDRTLSNCIDFINKQKNNMNPEPNNRISQSGMDKLSKLKQDRSYEIEGKRRVQLDPRSANDRMVNQPNISGDRESFTPLSGLDESSDKNYGLGAPYSSQDTGFITADGRPGQQMFFGTIDDNMIKNNQATDIVFGHGQGQTIGLQESNRTQRRYQSGLEQRLNELKEHRMIQESKHRPAEINFALDGKVSGNVVGAIETNQQKMMDGLLGPSQMQGGYNPQDFNPLSDMGVNSGNIPQYNSSIDNQYNSDAQSQFNPHIPQQFNPNIPPQFNPNVQQQFNPNIPPQFNPGVQQQFNPNVQHQFNPNVQHQFNPNISSQYIQQSSGSDSYSSHARQQKKLNLDTELNELLQTRELDNVITNQPPDSSINVNRPVNNNQSNFIPPGFQPNMQHNMQPNMQPGFQPNVQPNIQPNLQPGFQPNIQHNMQPNMQPGFQPNMQHNMQPNMQNMQPGFQSNIIPTIQSGYQQTMPPKNFFFDVATSDPPIKNKKHVKSDSKSSNDKIKRLKEQNKKLRNELEKLKNEQSNIMLDALLHSKLKPKTKIIDFTKDVLSQYISNVSIEDIISVPNEKTNVMNEQIINKISVTESQKNDVDYEIVNGKTELIIESDKIVNSQSYNDYKYDIPNDLVIKKLVLTDYIIPQPNITFDKDKMFHYIEQGNTKSMIIKRGTYTPESLILYLLSELGDNIYKIEYNKTTGKFTFKRMDGVSFGLVCTKDTLTEILGFVNKTGSINGSVLTSNNPSVFFESNIIDLYIDNAIFAKIDVNDKPKSYNKDNISIEKYMLIKFMCNNHTIDFCEKPHTLVFECYS
jgi:hypothetical protein